MALFINHHPAYGSWVSKIIAMDFEDIEGLPIETSNPAFGEGFVKAELTWMPWGQEGYAIRFVVNYDPSIVSNETAVGYAYTVSEEIIKVTNQTNLRKFFSTAYIDNSTNTRVIIVDHGFLPATLSSLESLLNHRPNDGFANLLTEKLLQKFIPGETDETGIFGQALSDLKYMLIKINDRYQWNFKIQFSIHTPLCDERWVETLDLNSLLLNDGLIQPSSQRKSEIIVEMPKRHSIPSGDYEVTFETLHPDGVVEEYDGWIRVVYQVTASIDNVVAAIKVNRVAAANGYMQFIIIGLIVVTLVIIVILIKKKRK